MKSYKIKIIAAILVLILSGCNEKNQIDIKLCSDTINVVNHITNRDYSVPLQSDELSGKLADELAEMKLNRIDETQLEVYDTINLSYCDNVDGGDFVKVLNQLNNIGILKINLGNSIKTKSLKFKEYCDGCGGYGAIYHVAKIDRKSVFYSVEKCKSDREKEVVFGSDHAFFNACYSSSFDKVIESFKLNDTVSLKIAKINTTTRSINYMDDSLWGKCVNTYKSMTVKSDDCRYDSHRIVIGNDSKMFDIESILAREITKYDSISETNGGGIGYWEIGTK